MLLLAPPLPAGGAESVAPRATAERLASLPERSRGARAEALRHLDLQLELPHGTEDDVGWHVTLPPGLLWLFLLGGAAVLAFALKDLLPQLGAATGDWSGDTSPGAAGAQTLAEAGLAADELAASGRFGEAMHMLLQQSLADLRRRLDERFADSLTSREILRRTRVPDTGRAALQEIVHQVERTCFGEHPADAADYRACRASFDRLAATLGTAATA